MPIIIYPEQLKDRVQLKGRCSGSRDLFRFREIIDNISEMVQDRDTVAVEM